MCRMTAKLHESGFARQEVDAGGVEDEDLEDIGSEESEGSCPHGAHIASVVKRKTYSTRNVRTKVKNCSRNCVRFGFLGGKDDEETLPVQVARYRCSSRVSCREKV